jgi:hypothetical protein
MIIHKSVLIQKDPALLTHAFSLRMDYTNTIQHSNVYLTITPFLGVSAPYYLGLLCGNFILNDLPNLNLGQIKAVHNNDMYICLYANNILFLK